MEDTEPEARLEGACEQEKDSHREISLHQRQHAYTLLV